MPSSVCLWQTASPKGGSLCKGKRMKKLICILLCLCLCGCAKAPEESRETVSLWYVEGSQPQGLEELVAKYNKERAEGTLPVSLRSFPHEQALAAAFELRAPELLLCDYAKAEQLISQGRLFSVQAEQPEYWGNISQSMLSAGELYFPIGSRVQLLAEGEKLFENESLRSLDAFCAAASHYAEANNSPVFTADDFSQLFSHAMLCLDTKFSAELARDKNNELFRYVYNLLAECALDGALLSSEFSSVDILARKALPYALADSCSLVNVADSVQVYPAPAFKGSLKYPAQALGIAVSAPQGRNYGSVAAFLDYVNQPRHNSALALDSGLVPAVANEALAENSLQSCLLEIGEYYTLCYFGENSEYMKNRLSFEAVFRNSIKRLY